MLNIKKSVSGYGPACCSLCRQEVDLHISLTHANIVKFRGACCDIRNPQPGKSAYEQDVSTLQCHRTCSASNRTIPCCHSIIIWDIRGIRYV